MSTATAVSAPCWTRSGRYALGEQDRDPEHDERDAVPDSPPRSEPGSRACDRLAAGRDERRHRRDVIRVRRVPEPEQHRDEENDTDRGAFGHPCDPVVEPEHASGSSAPMRSVRSQRTPGSARAVMTTPTARMRAALAAGSARTSGPSKDRREKVRRAKTATRPIAVIVAARPRLKATISASPRPIRWSAIADRRTTSAEGQGSRPAAIPTPRIPFEVSASSWSWW